MRIDYSQAVVMILFLGVIAILPYPPPLPNYQLPIVAISKSDGEPGIVAIWRDWLRLQDFAAAWELIVNERTLLVGNR